MTGKDLRQEIIEELQFDPSLNSEHISIDVRGGTVTLSGHVGSYSQRVAAQRAAGRVKGVKAVVLDLEVTLPSGIAVTDDEIATRAVCILEWNSMLPPKAVHVTVNNGRITLTGEVEWQYQRIAAEEAVRPLPGVVAVINNLAVKHHIQMQQVKQKIAEALQQKAEHEADWIQVSVAGDTVTLDGKVRDSVERLLVRNAAFSAPGVKHVEDRLTIG